MILFKKKYYDENPTFYTFLPSIGTSENPFGTADLSYKHQIFFLKANISEHSCIKFDNLIPYYKNII